MGHRARRRRAFGSAIAVMVAFAALVAVVSPSQKGAAAAASSPAAAKDIVKVFARHDATVIESKPDQKTGNWQRLHVRSDPGMTSFVKFNVPDSVGAVSGATLRLYVESDVWSRVRVHRSNRNWTEANITYSTAPKIWKNAIGTYWLRPGKRWLDVDVSAHVEGPGGYSFAVIGLAGKKAVFSSSEGTRKPRLLLTPAGDGQAQPEPPIRAAFMYPWFPNAWDQGGSVPFSQFTPSDGLYSSADPATIDRQVAAATDAGLEAFIASWWGPGHHTDVATRAVVEQIPRSPNPDFRLAIYYEEEGQSNPSATEIVADLDGLRDVFAQPAYLRVDGKPVVFVWATSGDGANMASRWADAKRRFGGDLHVVLKVFSGYRDIPDQPDSWHQYGPASAYSEHLPHSAVVSPGFWHAEEGSARLDRDPARFRADVKRMVDSGAFWQLITTWNEWGEGTIVEPADEFGMTYLDILADELGGSPPSPTTTTSTTTTSTTTTSTTATPTTTTTSTIPPPGAGFTFAAAGDFGKNEATDATLASIGAGPAEFLLALGDLSYEDATETQWCRYVKGYLGNAFPVQLVVGNHEDDDRVDNVFILDFADCLPDRMSSTGTYAAEYYFDVDGLARIIMIGAGNDIGGEKYDYEIGNSHYQWLEQAIDGARSAGLEWVVVGMHKPCISVGNKSCEVGSELFDLLLDKRVDLVLHGHDHTYQRSKQLTCATPETFVSACVADDGQDGRYDKGAGTVFVIAANPGGGALTSVDTRDDEMGYIAAWHGGNSPDPGRGYVVVTIAPGSLQASFVGSTTSYSDSFVID